MPDTQEQDGQKRDVEMTTNEKCMNTSWHKYPDDTPSERGYYVASCKVFWDGEIWRSDVEWTITHWAAIPESKVNDEVLT